MALILQHCSKTVQRDRDVKTTKQTYVGTESQVDAKISTLKFGEYQQGYGSLDGWEKQQKGGILYQVTITWKIEYDSDGNEDSKDDLSQVQRSTLSCSILSMPLQAAPNYKTNWNYYLIGLGESASSRPSFWSSATDTFINPTSDDFKNYRWIKQLSEMPTEKDPDTQQYWQVVKGSGEGACKPQKMGVESFDYSTYSITEVKEFNNRTKAGQSASKNLNKVVSKPTNGDFGVTPSGCNWKVDSAQVQYDGEKWIVTTVYTMSGNGGWDSDLYSKIN